MTRDQVFDWQAGAGLFAGTDEIGRKPVSGPRPFQAIAAHTTRPALAALAGLLGSGTAFCLHPGPWDPAQHARPGDFLTLTGGTTGNPKIIQRSQASWIRSFEVNTGLFNLTSSDSVAVLGNLNHSLALYGILEALHLGLDAHCLDTLAPSRQRARIASQGIGILYATPAQLRLLLGSRRAEVLPSVRLVLCGGGQIDRATRQAVRNSLPNADLRVFYGAAETSFITLAGPDTPEGSVGKPYPGVEIDLRTEPGGPSGAHGEVWVKSPYLFDRYIRGASSVTICKDGFVTVGEFGQLDADGHLWLKGRRNRMVTIADQNVFPEEVETLINNHTNGAHCAVLARPDALRGHRLIAIVEGAENPDLARHIQDLCRRTLGPLSTPKQVIFRRQLPMLPSGKTDLNALEASL